MADGDIRIGRYTGSVRTTASGGTILTPNGGGWPSIVTNDFWVLRVTVWRAMEDLLDSADGPYIKSWTGVLNVEKTGTGGGGSPAGVFYAKTISVLQDQSVALGSSASDTIDLDYVGGLRLWCSSGDATYPRRWFLDGVLYQGVHTVV